MKTAEEISISHGLCTCDVAYIRRNMVAPDCPWHSMSVEDAMEEYAYEKVKAAEEKFDKDYRRFKREYKAQADAECLSIALSHAEDDIRRKEFPKVVKVALQTAAEKATAHTESIFPSVHYCECCPVVDSDSILSLEQEVLEKLNVK